MKISTDKLLPNPYNTRKDVGDINDLVKSIKKYGLWEPFLARREEGGIEVAYGYRRLKAARAAGLEKVPVQIKKINNADMAQLSLIENTHRKDLNPLEQAEAYARALKVSGLNAEAFAESIGKGESTVHGYLRMLELPKEVKDKAERLGYTARDLLALASVTDTSREVLCSLDQRIADNDFPVALLNNVVHAVQKIYHSPLASDKKASIATTIILQDYTYLKRRDYEQPVIWAEKLIQKTLHERTEKVKREVEAEKHKAGDGESKRFPPSTEPKRLPPSAQRHLPPYTAPEKPELNYDRILQSTIDEMKKLTGKLEWNRDKEVYRNAIANLQRDYVTSAAKLVKAAKDVIGSEE